ncbi:class I SAM-dependent methyltransferase [Marinilabilia salmonicolor]|uniref:class I SAM-dependent methyltransferase n=1 Tax=Marinilabilia salmonicolor TaxID=989 RepID=UPI00030EA62B|nr:class I SAM-dependent methyltransferase [Marinilabilia salmonicolor]
MNITEYNKTVWDKYVANKVRWTIPVSKEEIENAGNGNWDIVLTPAKPVPHDWFPDLKGLRILGLASGGGQQGPILAALGAEVTIFDNSENQLNQDRKLSDEFNLNIKTVQGDMKDLSVFADESFDLIFNPCSAVFADNLKPIWQECSRVLKSGGILMTGLINPVIFQLDQETVPFQLIYSQPYSDLDSLPKEKLDELIESQETLEFGHSLTDEIGGQLNAGFLITDFYEDDWNGEKEIDKYLPSFFATRAVKK